MRSFFAIAALAAFAKAQDATTSSAYSWDTSIPSEPADALDFDGIEAVPDPTYTEVLGLKSQVIPYATATAIKSAAADITADPLTVFPAATDVAMNADGDSDSSAVKRNLNRRDACDPVSTIANTYGVDISSYDNFKADKIIEGVAAAAATPAGYYQNFQNLKGASRTAYAYLGYDQLTFYDVSTCAANCNKKTGCLAFNIYFERAPKLVPSENGGACDVPDAYANIKCSYWGSVLDQNTADNYGQWQGGFQLAISGSNAYSSSSTGGPIDGCSAPQFFNTTVLNAPLRDCTNTWTYMGYKLYTSGPYEPRLCKAACDSQNVYNRAHPPSTGSPAICAGFGSYTLTKTNSTGSFAQGQMCTLYTSNWSSKYAVNKVAYNDAIGAKYTYSLSYFYALNTQPTCPVTAAKRDLVPSRLFRF